MAAGFDIPALQALIDSFRSDGIDGDDLTDIAQTIKNILEQNDTDSLDLAWDSGETYDTKTTAATSGNPYLSEFGDRFWKSKTDGNTNNQPPSDPEITSDTYWEEVSKAASNAISEWTAGVYGDGLIIVFYNDALYKLTVATRPYESENIITEITAGDWLLLFEGITGSLSSLNTTDKSNIVAAINELVAILSSNDVNYDELQELVDFIKTIDTDGELLAVIDSAVGNSTWRTFDPSTKVDDITGTDSATHSTDGGDLTIDFDGIDYFTLTLDDNLDELTFNNLPLRRPVFLRIEQNASVGYSITTIANLDNPDGVFPDYSTTADEDTLWKITAITATKILVEGYSTLL